MNVKKRILFFLVAILTLWVAWAFSPSNITQQPSTSVASVIYAWDSTAGAFKVCNVDSSGNLLTSNQLATNTPTITSTPTNTPTPGATNSYVYRTGTDLADFYNGKNLATNSFINISPSLVLNHIGNIDWFKNYNSAAEIIFRAQDVGQGIQSELDIYGDDNSGFHVVGSGLDFTTDHIMTLTGSTGIDVSGSPFLDMGNAPITNMASPTTSNEAATKGYVDGLIPSGLFYGAVTFTNALTTPVTTVISGASSTSQITFGERGTAVASSFGWTSSGANTIIFNGTFAGAATCSYIGIK